MATAINRAVVIAIIWYWIYNFLCNKCLLMASYTRAHGEVYSIQLDVIKFISGFRQVGGFLRVLRLHPPIKLRATT